MSSDQIIQVDKNNNIEINNEDENRQFKTKSYVRRAQSNYRNKRLANDPEFKERTIELSKNYRNKNIEKIKQYQRDYMKAYRIRKKNEKNNNTDTTSIDTLTNNITKLEVN
jgi:hypothetical protein